MTYRVELVEDSDLDYIVPRMFEAIGNDNEFLNVMWPGHHTPEGQGKIVSRFLAGKNAAQNTKWIKAVAEDSGEIVGFAMFTVIDQQKPPEVDVDGPPGTWANEKEKKYCQALYRSLLAPRRKAIRENYLPIMLTNMMAVFTEHQRKGIGMLLLDWGLHLADKLQALCILEGSLIGQNLYRKGGFAVEQDMIIDPGEEYADRPKDHVVFMVRPRGGSTLKNTGTPRNGNEKV